MNFNFLFFLYLENTLSKCWNILIMNEYVSKCDCVAIYGFLKRAMRCLSNFQRDFEWAVTARRGRFDHTLYPSLIIKNTTWDYTYVCIHNDAFFRYSSVKESWKSPVA